MADKIKITYLAVDGFTKEATFTDLGDAQRYAQYHMGKYYERAGSYAISGDGVSKIMVEGATINKLFEEIY